MAIGNKLLGFFLTTLFFITLTTYLFTSIGVAQGNGITSWAENPGSILFITGLFTVLILINVIRLKLGMGLVLMKNQFRHQSIILVFVSMMLAAIGLVATHSYILVLSLFVAGLAGGLAVQFRVWTVFTEISEIDHIVFRKRLKMSGMITAALIALTFFNSSSTSYGSKILFALFFGYLLSSFFVGYVVVRNQIVAVMDVANSIVESAEKRDDDSLRRYEENLQYNRSRGRNYTSRDLTASSDVSLASMGRNAVIVVSLMSALLVGLVVIPFYIYVLATNKVTISNPVME